MVGRRRGPHRPLGAAPAHAGSTSTLRVIDMGYGDYIYNYDFNDTTVSSSQVDWAVSLIFTKNASINTAKGSVSDVYLAVGGSKNGRINAGAGWVWDSDGGRKTASCSGSGGQTDHFRLYADGDDRMYNPRYGYYVIGTIHVDYPECSVNPYFGGSEAAEGRLAQLLKERGYRVAEDAVSLSNYEPAGTEGNHRWSSNGLATLVEIS